MHSLFFKKKKKKSCPGASTSSSVSSCCTSAVCNLPGGGSQPALLGLGQEAWPWPPERPLGNSSATSQRCWGIPSWSRPPGAFPWLWKDPTRKLVRDVEVSPRSQRSPCCPPGLAAPRTDPIARWGAPQQHPPHGAAPIPAWSHLARSQFPPPACRSSIGARPGERLSRGQAGG